MKTSQHTINKKQGKMVKKKYNYNSLESQKLFEEFSLLLSEITKYVEEKEIASEQKELALKQKIVDLAQDGQVLELQIKSLESKTEDLIANNHKLEENISSLQIELSDSKRIRNMIKEILRKIALNIIGKVRKIFSRKAKK